MKKSKEKEIDNFYKMTNDKKNNNKNSKIVNSKNVKKSKKKKQKKKSLKKYVFFATLLLLIIVLILRSKIFNISNIIVNNNSKISTEEIINLSGLQIGQNMFKINNSKIINNLKQNAYIGNIKVKKHLNCIIEIEIEERIPTYQIEINNQYAYINNQGYVLEVSMEKLEIPIIYGINTGDINTGNRLQINDLKKLNDVIQIMNIFSSKMINKPITKFNISDDTNYIIYMESDKKTINFGDINNINDKIDWIEYILKEEKDIEGEIFVQNVKKPYFREKVSI